MPYFANRLLFCITKKMIKETIFNKRWNWKN